MDKYVLTIFSDHDSILADHFEFAEDIELAEKHGLVSYSLDKITTCDHCKQTVKENLDSCGGFVAVEDFEDDMRAHWQSYLPEDVSEADVEVVYKMN